MRNLTRRSLFAGGAALILASCSAEPEPNVVSVPQPPKDVEVTATADPINDAPSTGGEAEEPSPLDDGQAEVAMEDLRVGVLTWANQKSDESAKDRSARLAPYVAKDSLEAAAGFTPFIQLDADFEEDEASEYQSTSGMVDGNSMVSSTPTTIIVDYQLRVVTEIAPIMDDDSHPDTVQADPYNYIVRVSGEWDGEKWLITNFTNA